MRRNNYPFSDLLRGVKRKFAFLEAPEQAFISIKDAITKIALPTRPNSSAPTSLVADALNTAVFQLRTDSSWKPLAFLSKQPAEPGYSGLLAIYGGKLESHRYVTHSRCSQIANLDHLWLLIVKLNPTSLFKLLRRQAHCWELHPTRL